MDKGVWKQRLVGAGVLAVLFAGIAAALVFVAGRGQGLGDTNIPAIPADAEATRVLPLDERAAAAEAVLEAHAQTAPANDSAAPAAEAPMAKTPAPAKMPSAGPDAAPKPETPADKPVARAKIEPPAHVAAASETTKADGGPTAQAWVVQLGSFATESNARSLRDQLRARGHSAFIEQGGGVFRVRIGPFVTRAEADRTREKVEHDARFSGMVLSYP